MNNMTAMVCAFVKAYHNEKITQKFIRIIILERLLVMKNII